MIKLIIKICNEKLQNNGAGSGAQTRDLCLGKAALYQLSYSRMFNAIIIIPKYKGVVKT